MAPRRIPLGLLAAFLLAAAVPRTSGAQGKLRILHYTFTGPGASRHSQAMDAAEKALQALARERDWESFRTEDPAYFTDANLAPYHVIFFDNVCCAAIFTAASQRQAVERFLRSGKGYVGSHAATASEPGWAFWVGLHGGVINNGHPDPDTGTAQVEYRLHPSTAGLPARWGLGLNEWFHYHKDLRANPKVRVLVSLPKGTIISGHAFTEDLPVSWCNYHEGARAFYSSLGHFPTAFTDPLQRDHFFGALEWAGGRTPRNGACGEPPTGTAPRPAATAFAERVFSARAIPGGVEVRLHEPGLHTLELRNSLGRLVWTSPADPGVHALPADGTGLHILRVTAGSRTWMRTLAVVR